MKNLILASALAVALAIPGCGSTPPPATKSPTAIYNEAQADYILTLVDAAKYVSLDNCGAHQAGEPCIPPDTKAELGLAQAAASQALEAAKAQLAVSSTGVVAVSSVDEAKAKVQAFTLVMTNAGLKVEIPE